jgi:DNA-binding LytR/AlgR family response regulator
MNAIVVDDDQLSINNLKYLCDKIPDLNVLGDFTNAIDALAFIRKNKIDVVFLDIEMPDFNGIELVKSTSDLPQIVFTTAKAEYAVQAFEYDATDYIQKPITLPRLQKSIERVEKINKENSLVDKDFIFVKSDRKLVKISFDDIFYIESVSDYVVFVLTNNKKLITHSTLKSMEERLNHPLFMKVHRAYIVNISKIVDIEDNAITMGNYIVPVSRANKSSLLEKLNAI